MATKKQIKANRENAKKSTGPRTPEGKRRVSMNALKHGLCAQEMVMTGEDPEEFEQLRDGFADVLEPADDFEASLVRQMISAEWRMRRADRVEVGTINLLADRRKDSERELPPHLRMQGTPEELEVKIGHRSFYAATVDGDATSKYNRYSTGSSRQFMRAYKLLEQRRSLPEIENCETKPISDNSHVSQQDTAIFAKPGNSAGATGNAQEQQ